MLDGSKGQVLCLTNSQNETVLQITNVSLLLNINTPLDGLHFSQRDMHLPSTLLFFANLGYHFSIVF
jgi:hypothetical protein